MKKFVLITALLLIVFSFVPVAYADGGDDCWDDFDLSDCDPPAGSTKVIDSWHTVTNDIDSGFGGYWAYDHYNKYVRAYEWGQHIYAIVQYLGDFVTVEGRSPANAADIPAGIEGTMEGGYVATFIPGGELDPEWPTTGYTGSFDFEGDPDTGTRPEAVNWITQYWPSYGFFAYQYWGWCYDAGSDGWWVNSADGSYGDIAGIPIPLSPCPQPEPEEPIVNRYYMWALVDLDAPPQYWGEGARNGSCWIKVRDAGAYPSVEYQASRCANDGLPEDFVYQADAVVCHGWVRENLATGEIYFCDQLWDTSWFDPDFSSN